jgi:hypothetical protein
VRGRSRSRYGCHNEHGGLRLDQAKRLKQPEGENTRLRRAVADLTVDNQILREAADGNFQARLAAAGMWRTLVMRSECQSAASARC